MVLLRLLQPNCGRHANEMQMQNLYLSCDEESNNIITSNWGFSRFGECPQFVHLMTDFGPFSFCCSYKS